MAADDPDEALFEKWYHRKTAYLVERLGEERDLLHSVISFSVGGWLDLYYFPQKSGTAIATKELSGTPGEGPSNDCFANYELVMFSRQMVSSYDIDQDSHRLIATILNWMARYSFQATLNRFDTCEFPADMDWIGGRCLIFDAYGDTPSQREGRQEFGLLALIEIHRSEMNFAREFGGSFLLEKLKQAGYYPYSDLNRRAVA
ncbi:MAG TPA: hypothetical protein VFG20_08035 [Planctomycetaceae bacterium]|nr:hypothetical protein [Planctomycetaceae bacterium]